MRKLVALSALVGSLASVPILYQQNPEAFQAVVRQAFERRAAPEPERPTVYALRAESQTEVLAGRKVRLTMDRLGHFYGEFRINGRRTRALVDTGATLVALNASTARDLGIRLSPSDFRHAVNTANGTARAAAATLDSIQLGRIRLENVEAVVLEDAALEETLVGMSFLARLRRFQIADGALLLEQ
ncbi:TIGR02281 family clan AA aspartic protease [Aquibium sp. A9E412]|uniref:TIGR02281 family clan AA aspartic protease n=1 Tax=Aquibium sp. A9E412 TaxID=2976767 RepID=UPI0025AEE55A|nr:TIGR02281 family clan AA aspartic protease [Aquibium sp. A9E412]MDN2566202.1 TIGR02281 family clan AA aspartic protease [Aquibium sp. A9E412]